MGSRLTAMDIEKQEFPRRVRGYDPEAVTLYLRSVAEEVERLNLDNAELREELGRVREQAEEIRSREQALQQTLVAAQQFSEDFKKKAAAEGELLVGQARFRAECLLKEAREELARVEGDIRRSHAERVNLEHRLRGIIEQHLALLELRSEARSERDNLRVLTGPVRSEAG
jgi:cell division initiation protein